MRFTSLQLAVLSSLLCFHFCLSLPLACLSALKYLYDLRKSETRQKQVSLDLLS